MSGQLKIISHSAPSSGESGEAIPISAIIRAEGGSIVQPTFRLGYEGPGSNWSLGVPQLEKYGLSLPMGYFSLVWPSTIPDGYTLDLTNYFYVNLPLPPKGSISSNLNWYIETGETNPEYIPHQRVNFQILANWPYPYPTYTIKCDSAGSYFVNRNVVRKLVVECNVVSPRNILIQHYLIRKSDGAYLMLPTGGLYSMIGTNRKEVDNDLYSTDANGMADGKYYVCSTVDMT